MQQVGSDVVLTINSNDSITFRDITIAQFQPQNFLLPLDTSQLGTMTFDDEFSSLQLWNPSTGQGHWQTNFGGDLTSANAYFIQGNDEKQLYTAPNFVGQDGWNLSAYNPFSINNGVLGITIGQFSYADSQHTWGQAYYSGMLNTRGLFMQKYGFFEMRAALPTDLGSWPALWMSQDPYNGTEADLLEHLAMYPDVAFERANDAGTVTGHTTYIPSLSGFHNYGMLWGPTTTTFYIDDMAVMALPTPASWTKPMYMILNLALGGWGGPIDASALPAQMQVDWIHVYGLASSPVQVEIGTPTYTAPAGVNSVTLIGSGQTVTANDAGDGLNGTAGADTFVLGRGGDTVTGNGGADTIKINSLPWAAAQITDFAADDRLDLTGLLSGLGYSGSNPVGAGVLQLTADGHGGAELWAAQGGQWNAVAVIAGTAPDRLAITGGVLTAGLPAGSVLDSSGTSFGHASPGVRAGSDYNGDQVSDVIFQNAATGDWGYAAMKATGGYGWDHVGNAGAGYAAAAKGDFNGDGVTDVVFRNNSPGDWGYAAMHPTSYTWVHVGNSGAYAAVGAGDFNGDGYDDVLFRDNGTGEWGFAAMTPSAYSWVHVGNSGASYAVAGTGDFNGDGFTDVIFANASTGDWGYAAMARSSYGWVHAGNAGPGYAVAGTGDFNGDGVSDILFRNASTGDWGYAAMNRSGGYNWSHIGGSDPAYLVAATGDYNGDGVTDVLFRNSATTDFGYVLMNNQGGVWHDLGHSDPTYFAL
jgi:beta-glucanase (GH16 family)